MKFKIKSYEELEQALERYAALKRKEAKNAARADAKIAATEKKLNAENGPVIDEMSGLYDEILEFMLKQDAEHGTRSKSFTIGTVTLVDTPPKVAIADEAKTLKALLQRYPEAVREIHRPDLDAIKKLPAAALAKLGIKIESVTVLRIKLAEKAEKK